MPTRVERCVCKHDYQDKKYGECNRLHNKAGASKSGSKWRCTVCGKDKN